jgi:hypothetical protein
MRRLCDEGSSLPVSHRRNGNRADGCAERKCRHGGRRLVAVPWRVMDVQMVGMQCYVVAGSELEVVKSASGPPVAALFRRCRCGRAMVSAIRLAFNFGVFLWFLLSLCLLPCFVL